MKKLSKILSVGLSLTLCAALVMPSFAAATFADLQGVIDSKASYTYEQDGETVTGISYDTATDTVKLNEEVKYESGDPSTITIKKDMKVTIDLNGNKINGNNQSDSVITIDEGGTLTLDDSTAYEKDEDGNVKTDENGQKVRKTDKDGNAVAGNGAITGGTGTTVREEHTFVSYSIQGGGVYNRGTFNMEAGTIKGNIVRRDSAAYGGGVYNAGTFSIKGGTLAGNMAIGSGDICGGGVYNAFGATFTMEAGTISGNTSKDSGGGVFNYGKFTMEGGTIAGNTSKERGGGVTNGETGTFTMEDGTIEGNKAECGGGGVFNYGKFTMEGGTIAGNTSKESGGGVQFNAGSFNMAGGTIAGNTATNNGGGVFLHYGRTFTMTGGTLAGNTANIAGDEIYGFINAGLKPLADSLWDRDNESDRENGVEKVYGAEDLKSISRTGLKHHEHKYTDKVTTEPTCTEAGKVVHTGCICGQPVTEPIDALGHEMGEWEVTAPARPGVAGVETRVCRREGCDHTETRSIAPLPVPAPTVEIEDVEVPLAGLFTRADAIGCLWQQAGSPEWELSDFADVPEDHEWAVAIGWAQDMGIAVADADGNFRPDGLVLRSTEDVEGELQEFLNRYAAYAGVELDGDKLFIELEGAADDVIMGEEAQVIFDDFFAKLEAAPAQAA